MRVKTGVSPENVDEQVRFRTTYYFRVYDYCYNHLADTKSQPQTDSLYRFVMTGKASPRSNIHFESGTLKAAQIDPFGATVKFDSNTGTYRYVSQDETRRIAKRGETLDEFDALLELKKKLIALNQEAVDKQQDPVVGSETIDAVGQRMKSLIGDLGSAAGETAGAQSLTADAQNALNCPPGSALRRGFQVMGPQGVKTFDQEDRLIMAMSSDAQPLIASLEQLSGRVLKAESSQQSDAGLLLALAREQLVVANLQRVLLEDSDEDDAAALKKKLASELGVAP